MQPFYLFESVHSNNRSNFRTKISNNTEMTELYAHNRNNICLCYVYSFNCTDTLNLFVTCILGIMGSDSPAALLDMLAEVASQTLHSEKKRSKSLLASQCKTNADYIKRRANESTFNVPQLLSMPASQLVKQFSIFSSDELKRQYSYTCALVIGCGQKYTSFASEGRARMSIKAHLAEHLEYLKLNRDACKYDVLLYFVCLCVCAEIMELFVGFLMIHRKKLFS